MDTLAGEWIMKGCRRSDPECLHSPEDLLKLMNENGNAFAMAEPTGVTARYDRELIPDAEGSYRVDVTWLPEETENGTLIRSVAEVRCDDSEAPLYRLETERFWTGVSA